MLFNGKDNSEVNSLESNDSTKISSQAQSLNCENNKMDLLVVRFKLSFFNVLILWNSFCESIPSSYSPKYKL